MSAAAPDRSEEPVEHRSVDHERAIERTSRATALQVGVTVAVVGLVGVVLRAVLLRSPVGTIHPDEAYTGIQGFEILNGNFPIVLGGTVYTWPFESYLYAPLVALFDGGSVTLKLLATASWVVASGVAYLAGRDLGSRRAGLIAGSLIWLTTGALLVISVTAYVSYSSGMLVTLTAFWLAIGITGTDVPRHWRPLVFGGLAGLGFWMHPMYVATLVPLVLFVLVVHRRRASVWAAVIGGGIAGCSPLLAWNARNGWPSLESPTEGGGTYTGRLTTFGRDLLPRAFGLRDASLEWYLGVGPVLYLALLALVVAGVVVSVRRVAGPPRWLLATVLVAVFPIMALFSAMIFAVDGRYGIIAYPFLVLAVAFALDAAMGDGRAIQIVAVGAAAAVFWLAGMVLPEVRFLAGLDIGGSPNWAAEIVADRLEEAGFEYVYGSYWQVLPVEYAGARRLTGGVIPVLPVRFPDRQRIVEAQDPVDVAFVFGPAEEDPSRLFMPPDRYERVELAGMIVYLPLPVADPAG